MCQGKDRKEETERMKNRYVGACDCGVLLYEQPGYWIYSAATSIDRYLSRSDTWPHEFNSPRSSSVTATS